MTGILLCTREFPCDVGTSRSDATDSSRDTPMILHTFLLTLEPPRPACGTAPDLRGFFAKKLAEYTELHRDEAGTFIYRYPVLQYKMIDNIPTAIGINEGAHVLKQISGEHPEIRLGTETCKITGHSAAIREEAFGIADTIRPYEFATPWLPFSQENYRRFYKLKGKEDRDGFVRKILVQNISSLSKSLGYDIPAQITCTTNLHFQKERQDGVSDMAFTGKFQVNFLIPDYLGIGRSVSHGFGAVKKVTKG